MKSLFTLTLTIALCSFLANSAPAADDGSRPYLGVKLDSNPLPEILVKHLQLHPPHGIRIANIYIDSPADKAGLQRDDIITKLNGKDVTDIETFTEDIRKTDADTQVTLEIIHLGQKQTVNIALQILQGGFDTDSSKWKYPPEPFASQTWMPGRIFKMEPGDSKWMQIPFRQMPEIKNQLKSFLAEIYTFYHSGHGQGYSVTIKGSPYEDDTVIIVKDGLTQHETTIDNVEALPEKYHQTVRNDIEEAKKTTPDYSGEFTMPNPEFNWPENFQFSIPSPEHFENLSPQNNDKFEQMQKKLEQLEQQIKQLQEKLN